MKNTIIIEVRKGMVELVQKPKGVCVEIHDYDTEGCDEKVYVETYEKQEVIK